MVPHLETELSRHQQSEVEGGDGDVSDTGLDHNLHALKDLGFT